MIDLHCHILPGIDDGAADLDDSIAMALQAAEDGVRVVCATPHIRHDHDVRIAELGERVDALNAELAHREILVRVAAGGEVAETAVDGLDDHELKVVSLGEGGRWVLLEPAPGPLGHTLLAAVLSLRSRGYRSVIAHPERHPSDDMRRRLSDLVAEGALVQVTAALLEGGPAAHGVLWLAEAGLVHLVASDSHSSRAGRPMRLSLGLAALAAVPAGRDHLDWIAHEAPAAIVRGEDLEPPFGVAL